MGSHIISCAIAPGLFSRDPAATGKGWGWVAAAMAHVVIQVQISLY